MADLHLLNCNGVISTGTRAGGDRNQDGALCAFISSVCRAAHRNLTPRINGPQVILDRHRPGGQATRFSTLIIMGIERTPGAKGTRR